VVPGSATLSFNVLGGTLANDGDTLRITAQGIYDGENFPGNQFGFSFGGTTLGLEILGGINGSLEAYITRTAAGSIRWHAEWRGDAASGACDGGTLAVTLASDQSLVVGYLLGTNNDTVSLLVEKIG
jgi:hypothetical protein